MIIVAVLFAVLGLVAMAAAAWELPPPQFVEVFLGAGLVCLAVALANGGIS